MKSINIIGDCIVHTSIGQLALTVIAQLKKAGYDVRFSPLNYDEGKMQIPKEVKKVMISCIQKPALVIASVCSLHRVTKPGESVAFVFIETTKVDEEYVKLLNKFKAVIVASDFNKKAFSSSGVKVPIYKVQLGVDMNVFMPVGDKLPQHCVFSTVGCMSHGERRKNLDMLMYAFVRALGKKEDAALWIKCFEECQLPTLTHPRIQIIRKCLQPDILAQFYQKSTAAIFASAAEGYGLPQLEAMVCGKPVINVNWGGVQEFFRPGQNGYAIEHKIEKADYHYNNVGEWAMPDFESIIEQMIYVYENRVEAFVMGQRAAMMTSHMSHEWMGANLLKVLKRIGLVL